MPISKLFPFSTITMLYKSPKIADTKASSTVDATDPCTSSAPSDNTSVITLLQTVLLQNFVHSITV